MSEPVIVVGAGVGGLSAAVSLAARGAKVTVVEAASGPGGKAGVTVLDGVEVDTGPSVLTLPHVFDDLLQTAGTRLTEHVTLREPDPAFRYHYPDGTTLDVRTSPEATLEEIRATFGADSASQMAEFMRYAERIWDAGAPNFVFGPAPTAATLLRLSVTRMADIARIDSMRSMWSAIQRHVDAEPLQWLLARYATYNGSDARRAPATLNCIAHVELGLGGFGIEGGIHALVQALVEVAEGLGVEFEYDTPVRRIVIEHGRAVGVETQGGLRRAQAVVANADAAHVKDDLLPEKAAARLPKNPGPSMSGYNALFRARFQASERPAHAVLFPRDYREEFADIFDRDRPPRDPTVYLCAQAVCHGRDTWPDAEPLFVMANAPAEPAQGARDAAEHEALAEVTHARLREHGLVAADDPVLWRRTPRELAERFAGSRGALYGAASNSTMAAFHRPPNRISKVPGLYMASGSAHPGGGLPLCAQSGRMAGELLGADLDLPAASTRKTA